MVNNKDKKVKKGKVSERRGSTIGAVNNSISAVNNSIHSKPSVVNNSISNTVGNTIDSTVGSKANEVNISTRIMYLLQIIELKGQCLGIECKKCPIEKGHKYKGKSCTCWFLHKVLPHKEIYDMCYTMTIDKLIELVGEQRAKELIMEVLI